ncbi:MAG: sugar phosphate isomerase/epimerase family protein [Erythrobacter sp.]|uniref:sugar phosphate isomerase/epimerase family protein n=1 Tax=Erythrobacter sp. TaxID=1042 RepID=UPI003299F113
MKFAMSNIAWAPEERLAAYTAMAGGGLTGLEIAPGLFFHKSADPFDPGENEAREALTEMADHGLSLVSMQSLLFGVQGAGLFEGEAARGAFINGMERAIDLAGRFGIPNLVFGSPAQRRVPSGMAMKRAIGEAAEIFRKLGDRAAQAGTCITMEPNPAAYGTNFLNTLEEVVEFTAIVGHASIAVILDLGAMHMNSVFEAVPNRLKTLTPMLNHVHVSEPELSPAPKDAQGLVPILASLDANGYTKAVSIEMRRDNSGMKAVSSSIASLGNAARAARLEWEDAHA